MAWATLPARWPPTVRHKDMKCGSLQCAIPPAPRLQNRPPNFAPRIFFAIKPRRGNWRRGCKNSNPIGPACNLHPLDFIHADSAASGRHFCVNCYPRRHDGRSCCTKSGSNLAVMVPCGIARSVGPSAAQWTPGRDRAGSLKLCTPRRGCIRQDCGRVASPPNFCHCARRLSDPRLLKRKHVQPWLAGCRPKGKTRT